MGLATARAAAEAGAAVTIASSSRQRLDAALADLPSRCDGLICDVRDEAAVTALFEHVGELDHLVYTAGEAPDERPLSEMSLARARTLFDIRFWGVVTALKSAVPRLRSHGSVVLTSGIIAERPAAAGALAASSVGAIETLARELAVDLAPIRVNTVRPGPIRTPMWGGLPPAEREAMAEAMRERTLTGTIGTPEQIAAANMYLMESTFVTGTVLTVDGGFVLAGS